VELDVIDDWKIAIFLGITPLLTSCGRYATGRSADAKKIQLSATKSNAHVVFMLIFVYTIGKINYLI